MNLESIALSPDGRLLAISGDRVEGGAVKQVVKLWDLERGSGNPAGAEAALRNARASIPETDMAYAMVLDILQGVAEESALSLDAMDPASRLYTCYVMGARAAHDGRARDAVAWYEKALEPRLDDQFETDIVAHHLRALGAR
jgi:hypothetical protein